MSLPDGRLRKAVGPVTVLVVRERGGHMRIVSHTIRRKWVRLGHNDREKRTYG